MTAGRTREWKKAVVQLHQDDSIELFEGQDASSMAIKKHKPTSPGRRFATWSDFDEITTHEPEKSLVEGLTKTGGRNTNGRITSRHRGGGAKRRYRKIDFKRRKDGVPAKVATIEYDPNRTAYIALLHYADGEKRYILAPQRLTVGGHGRAPARTPTSASGNALPLRNIPTGTVVHNVELTPGRGGQIGRSAGAADPARREGGRARRRCASPSGEMRMVRPTAAPPSARSATPTTRTSTIGKAGR